MFLEEVITIIEEAFETSDTGINDRATALAAAAVAAYASPTREGVEAIRTERQSLFDAIVALHPYLVLGPFKPGSETERNSDTTGVQQILADLTLLTVLDAQLNGSWTGADANGFDEETPTTAAITRVAALEAHYIAAIKPEYEPEPEE